MIIKRRISIVLLLALGLAFTPATLASGKNPTQADPGARARALLVDMTPEERVGQLFLVSFNGTKTDEKSSIYDLIVNHYIGGVTLQAANDNFIAPPDTLSTAYRLINQLQKIEFGFRQGTLEATPTSVTKKVNQIPLFVGVSQDGDGAPNDQIMSGLTPLPNPMAIGATWNTDLAHQVGEVAGHELSAIGFNLFLGPPLDVLDSPDSTLENGLAADVFGGDPYWVGAMGQAYVQGLHTGSYGRLLVIGKHFPGQGSSDRPEGEEPATVRKSLEQLKQIELAPFFAVTGNADDPQGVVDGLLISHIRYQGFQGNIRATTRPISFDPKALTQILSLAPFTTWRQNGGLMVSDDLGSQTVRLFYAPGGQAFQATQVSLDAFLAGNDLLYLGNIQSSDTDSYATDLKILDFFIQKYRQDPVFAQRIDDSVLRILTAKYRLYNSFDLASVTPLLYGVSQLGQSNAVTIDVARQSATLVSPSLADLDTVLPSPPSARDRMVFLTDTRPVRQCSTCPQESSLSVDALQNAILHLYGTGVGGPIPSYHLISYSFNDLAALLQQGVGNQAEESDLRQAQWIVISTLDEEPNQPQTNILQRFLSERQDLLRDKRVIVFSFNAPYYLDATNISKLTAYYCLYSKSAPFVDVAARLLFQELAPVGSLPVSVTGRGYDLFTATSPDPNQVIELSLELPVFSATPLTATPAKTPTTSFKVGDTVTVKTGIILDQNHHQVPDGTGVSFTLSSSGAGGAIQQIDAVTMQGIAHASFSIARPGLLEIRATSESAITSVILQLNVSSEGFSVTVLAPTPITSPTPTAKAPAAPNPERPLPPVQGAPGFRDWISMIVVLGGMTFLAYWLGSKYRSSRWGIRWAICTLMGGLLFYNYLALRLPGTTVLIQATGLFGIIGMVLTGAALGWGIGFGWSYLLREPKKQPD
jgi:beta-N-acetylhexosaminidase